MNNIIDVMLSDIIFTLNNEFYAETHFCMIMSKFSHFWEEYFIFDKTFFKQYD